MQKWEQQKNMLEIYLGFPPLKKLNFADSLIDPPPYSPEMSPKHLEIGDSVRGSHCTKGQYDIFRINSVDKLSNVWTVKSHTFTDWCW